MTLRIKDKNTNETILINSLNGKKIEVITGDVVDLEIDKKSLVKTNTDLETIAKQAILRVESIPEIQYVIIGHRYLCKVNSCKLYNLKLTFGIMNTVTNQIEERDILLNEIIDLETANTLNVMYEKKGAKSDE